MKDKYIELLAEALVLFYQNDAESLFVGRPAHEQVMSGCIARYISNLLKSPNYCELLPNVDSEYDKMLEHNQKSFEGFVCKDKNCYNFCGFVIDTKIRELNKRKIRRRNESARELIFRPDLIIHKRNKSLNGLVVECKKQGFAKKLNKNVLFDMAKLRTCTCKQRSLGYKVGAFVILGKECSHVKIFIDSIKKESFWVDKDGRHEYSKENKEPCYISK